MLYFHTMSHNIVELKTNTKPKAKSIFNMRLRLFKNTSKRYFLSYF